MRTRVWHTSSRVNPRCEWPGADDCGLASDGGVAPDKSAGAVRPAHVELAHAIPGLRNEICATKSASAHAMRAQLDEIRPGSIRASSPGTMRAELTSSNRLPPRGGNAQTKVK